MNVVTQIQGRDAIPVRAIPFAACWFFGPEELAKWLSKNGNSGDIQSPKTYQLDDGEIKLINASEWVNVEFDISCLTFNLKANQGEFSEWQRRTILRFPSATSARVKLLVASFMQPTAE